LALIQQPVAGKCASSTNVRNWHKANIATMLNDVCARFGVVCRGVMRRLDATNRFVFMHPRSLN
jgi:hypothetical protein